MSKNQNELSQEQEYQEMETYKANDRIAYLQDKSDERNNNPECPECGSDDVSAREKGSYCWDCGWKESL